MPNAEVRVQKLQRKPWLHGALQTRGHLVRTPESVMTTSFIFLMPLTFASNIFVELSTMPGWLQAIVGRNPVTHLATASRGLMHGEPVGRDVIAVLVASAIIVAVASPIAMKMYRRER
jgi:ABC-2 type transport system permease protein